MSKPKRRFKYDPADGLMPEILKIIAPPTTETPHASRRELNEAKRAERLEQETWKNVESQICSFCFTGGNILCCEECPASFHLSCLALSEQDVPDGVWLCNRCQHSSGHLKCSNQPTSSSNNGQFPTPILRAEREQQRNEEAIRFHLAKEMEKCKDLQIWPNSDLLKVFTWVNPVEFALPKDLLEHHIEMPQDNVEKARPEITDKICRICLKKNTYSPMLKCDYCPRIYHKDCIDPPLTVLPTWRKWMCPAHVENIVDESMGGRIMVNSMRQKEWEKYTHNVDLSSQQMYEMFMQLSKMAISVRNETLNLKCERFRRKKKVLITPYNLTEDTPSTSNSVGHQDDEITSGESCVSKVLTVKSIKARKTSRTKKAGFKFKPLDHAYIFTNCPKSSRNNAAERKELVDSELDELDNMRSIPMSDEEIYRSIFCVNEQVRRNQLQTSLSDDAISNMRNIVAIHDNVMSRNVMLAAFTEEQEMINRQWQSLNVSSEIRGASVDYYMPKFRGKEEKGKRRVVAECDMQLLSHGYGNGQQNRRFSSIDTEMFYQRCPPPLPANQFASKNALRHIVLSSEYGITDFANCYAVYNSSRRGLHNKILLMFDHGFDSRENRDTFYSSSMTVWSKEPFVKLMERWRIIHADEPKEIKIENPEVLSSNETSNESSPEPPKEKIDSEKCETPPPAENLESSTESRILEEKHELLENGVANGNGYRETDQQHEHVAEIGSENGKKSDVISMDSDEFWKDTFIIPPINSCRDGGDLFENLKIILPKWQMDSILPDRSNVYRTLNNLVVVRYGRNLEVKIVNGSKPETCEHMALKHHPDFYEKFPECFLKKEISSSINEKTHVDLTIDEVVSRVRVEEGMSRSMEKRFASRYLEIKFDMQAGVENLALPVTQTCTSKDETYCSLASSSGLSQCPFHGSIPPPPSTPIINGHKKIRKPRYKFLHPILRDHDYALPPPGFNYQIEDPLFPTFNEFTTGFFEYESSGPLTPAVNGVIDRTVPLRGMYPRKRGRPPGSKNKIREDEFGNLIKKRKDEQSAWIGKDGSPIKRGRGRPKGSASKKGSNSKREKKLNGSLSSEEEEDEKTKSDENLKRLKAEVQQIKEQYSKMMVGLLAQYEKLDYMRTRDEAIQHWRDSQWEQLKTRYEEERALSLFPFDTRFLLPNVTVLGYLKAKTPSNPLPFAIQRGLTKLGSAHDCHIRIDRISKIYCQAIQEYHCDIVFDKVSKEFYLLTLANSVVIVDDNVVFRKKLPICESATRSRLKGKNVTPATLCHCELELSRLKAMQKLESRRIETGVVSLRNKSTIRIGCVTLEMVVPERR